ncbi:hypothetical protein GGI23_004836, partial [Coemansia sp. RSA 2559]
KFGKALHDLTDEKPLDSILKFLGGNWSTTWKSAEAGEGVFASAIVQDIIDKCLADCKSERSTVKSSLEYNYQVIIDSLAKQIEATLRERGIEYGVYWSDRHNSPMPDASKPDGLLLFSGGYKAIDWKSVAVAFELKSDNFGTDNFVLKGQLYSYLASMLKDQPRRHSIGMSVSKDGVLCLYVCLPSKVYYQKVGCLPGGNMPNELVLPAVRFLMLLYLEAARDYGFVTNGPCGLFTPFRFRDVVGVDLESIADIADMEISLQGSTSLSGRHTQPVGAQSWIYKDDNNSIVKVHWCHPENSEIATHRRVLEMGIPYVPKLLDSVTVKHPFDAMQGELLKIDDAGISIANAIIGRNIPSHTVIDLFAGYSHTILAASSGRGGMTVLHRDISAGNLLVRESKPFVIDWGLGLCTHGASRIASTTPRVGTAPFMGIRVLNAQPKRSCIDDLESLFLTSPQQLEAVVSEKPSKIPRLTVAGSSKVGKIETKGRYNFRARGGKENSG